jgi:hypothetical protein
MSVVDSWVHKFLDLGVNPNPRAGHAPFQGGVASTKVSTQNPVSVAFMILSFHWAHSVAQGPRVVMASHEMSTHPSMHQGGRRSMLPMRKCELGGREIEREKVRDVPWDAC